MSRAACNRYAAAVLLLLAVVAAIMLKVGLNRWTPEADDPVLTGPQLGLGSGDRAVAAMLPGVPTAPRSGSPSDVADHDSFELRLGDIARLGNEMPLVKFTEVVDDSRCLEGEQCIWEGEVRVAVSWSSIEETTSLDLWGLLVESRPMFGERPTVTIADYELSLTGLRYEDGLPVASFAWSQGL